MIGLTLHLPGEPGDSDRGHLPVGLTTGSSCCRRCVREKRLLSNHQQRTHSFVMPLVTVVLSLTHSSCPPSLSSCHSPTCPSSLSSIHSFVMPLVTVVLSLTVHAPRHCRPVTHCSCPSSLSSSHSLFMPLVTVILSLTLHAPRHYSPVSSTGLTLSESHHSSL